jgi:hypothetical protein
MYVEVQNVEQQNVEIHILEKKMYICMKTPPMILTKSI